MGFGQYKSVSKEDPMKTLLVVVLYSFVSFTAFAQEAPPTEQEVIRIIETYWRCIGAAENINNRQDVERYVEGNLSNYSTQRALRFATTFILRSQSLDESQRNELRQFRVLEVLEMEKHESIPNAFNITIRHNCSGLGNDTFNISIIKADGIWKIA
jgi:hypothetical protein